ncbi:hypothetical protein K458DRAFT_445216 [Lentithecium fluviatile CBS 122367]|uniref:Uncharacterized protein n=1 Tax=Lentithecium fluviatile CBS 122367 TaxID=1168545 RepID=A0A6G1IQJ4_9PLEO|nr:hypothetical protein K458DRAFT_445216 [Lentithecium fluviatile CBS 122367]
MDEYEEAVLFTFALLESRLDRLEYILGGAQTQKAQAEEPKTVTERIQKIEKSLQELSTKTALLNDARELLNKHKDLLKPEEPKENAGLDASQKAVMVVERAPGFATTASQLKALDDQQIPQTDGFTKLAKLRPRIAEAEDRHLQQALQISVLRKQSGLLVQRVKQIHFLGAARVWVEWHKRLQNAQRTVARIEYKQKQEEEGEVL